MPCMDDPMFSQSKTELYINAITVSKKVVLLPNVATRGNGNSILILIFHYFVQDHLGSYHAPQYFQTIERNFASSQKVWRKDWEVPIECLRKGLMEGVRLDVYFPGKESQILSYFLCIVSIIILFIDIQNSGLAHITGSMTHSSQLIHNLP